MTAAQSVRPFPWASLESLPGDEARLLRDARRWATRHADLAGLPAVMEAMLAAPVTVSVRRTAATATARGLQGGAGVLLARADAPHLSRGLLVEAEPALVANVLRRVVRKPSTFAMSPPSSLPTGAYGAFAAVIAAAARRVHTNLAVRTLAAGPAAILEGDMARAVGRIVAVGLTVLVADDAFEARVVVPAAAAATAADAPWDATTLARLGPAPLSVPVVASAASMSATEAARLGLGDVLLLPDFPLSVVENRLVGRVVISPSTSSAGLVADLRSDGTLVLGRELVNLEREEPRMGEVAGREELVDAIGDVPVIVRVEVGEATMPAREWARIGLGDVVALGRRLGELVVVRLGGVMVARGELVDVDGTVGVRIVERFVDREARG